MSDNIEVISGDGSHTHPLSASASHHSDSEPVRVKDKKGVTKGKKSEGKSKKEAKKSHSSSNKSEEEVNDKSEKKEKKEKKGPTPLVLASIEWMKKFLAENTDPDKQIEKLEEIGIDHLTQIEKQYNKKPKDRPTKRNAYQIWMDRNKDHPCLADAAKNTDRMRLLAPYWKEFKESKKKADTLLMKELEAEAEEEKAKYDAWMATHKTEITIPVKKGKDYPAKPQNAKGLFKIAARKKRKVELRKEHKLSSKKKLPTKVTEKLNAELEEKWKLMSKDKRAKWEELHKEKMKEWEKKCKAYVAPKEKSCSFEMSD
jgi:hypothetical protein